MSCPLILVLHLPQRTGVHLVFVFTEQLCKDQAVRLSQDVYLILNAAHLLLQMVLTVPFSLHRNKDLSCCLPFTRFLSIFTPPHMIQSH